MIAGQAPVNLMKAGGLDQLAGQKRACFDLTASSRSVQAGTSCMQRVANSASGALLQASAGVACPRNMLHIPHSLHACLMHSCVSAHQVTLSPAEYR